MADEHTFKVGDLVVYKRPIKFFTSKETANGIFGVITRIDGTFHAKILWSDEVCCLESFEDILHLDETN
jgi:hypothetical protein